MDGLMRISEHYALDTESNAVSIRCKQEPFSSTVLPTCPTCRGPLRDTARYGRIVRRALLDDSAKKFTSWSNTEYGRLAKRLQDQHDRLSQNQETAVHVIGTVTLADNIDNQLAAITALHFGKRYKYLFELRRAIVSYTDKVRADEQPFQRVKDLVESIRRQTRADNTYAFTFNSAELQLREHLQGIVLLLRCDIVLLSDFISARQKSDPTSARGTTKVNFTSNRKQCDVVIEEAERTLNVRLSTEARVLWARFAAVECGMIDTLSEAVVEVDPTAMEHLKRAGFEYLLEAEATCDKSPGPTQGLGQEIVQVRNMLETATIYDDMRMVVKAMTAEFSGTGHWYRCANGHPFTVGECGMPMEMAKCPACGAGIGGQSHRPTEGVTHAHDIEKRFGSLAV